MNKEEFGQYLDKTLRANHNAHEYLKEADKLLLVVKKRLLTLKEELLKEEV